MIKKVLSVLVAFMFMISMTCYMDKPVHASEDSNTYDIDSVISEIVKEFYNDVEVEVKDVNIIYSSDDKVIECSLDIYCDNICYGYMIYDYNLSQIIKFKVERDSEGFELTHLGQEVPDGKIIKKVDLLNYEIDEDNRTYLAAKTNLFTMFFEDLDIAYSSNILTHEKYIPNICSFGEDYITDILGTNYCCAAVAVLNVLMQYERYDPDSATPIEDTYAAIWSVGGVEKIKVKDEDGKFEYEYVMDQEVMGFVVREMSVWYGYERIQFSEKENPKVSFFTDAVDKKYASILGIVTTTGSGIAGHAVNVVGYLKFKPITYGNESCYLAVATGWGYEDDIEYLLYDKIDVVSTYGVKFLSKIK